MVCSVRKAMKVILIILVVEFLMSVYESGDGPLVYPVLLNDGTNLGYVEGGADTVIEALMECVKEQGSIYRKELETNSFKLYGFD